MSFSSSSVKKHSTLSFFIQTISFCFITGTSWLRRNARWHLLGITRFWNRTRHRTIRIRLIARDLYEPLAPARRASYSVYPAFAPTRRANVDFSLLPFKRCHVNRSPFVPYTRTGIFRFSANEIMLAVPLLFAKSLWKATTMFGLPSSSI